MATSAAVPPSRPTSPAGAHSPTRSPAPLHRTPAKVESAVARRSPAFATFLILCPTAFFLGILFSLFPYDYPILWAAPTAELTYPARLPISDPFTTLETHLALIHASPPLIPRMLHIIGCVGFAGFIIKLYRGTESNMLFDGASLALYMVATIVYLTNIVSGLRAVSTGDYTGAKQLAERGKMEESADRMSGDWLGREDSLRVISASHTIMALVLVGVLVLQAGQWYAERKEVQEEAKWLAEREAKIRAGATAAKKRS